MDRRRTRLGWTLALRSLLLATALSFAGSQPSWSVGGGGGGGTPTALPAFSAVFPTATMTPSYISTSNVWPIGITINGVFTPLSKLEENYAMAEYEDFTQQVAVKVLFQDCMVDNCTRLNSDATPTSEWVNFRNQVESLKTMDSNLAYALAQIKKLDPAFCGTLECSEAQYPTLFGLTGLPTTPTTVLTGPFGIPLEFAPSDQTGFPPDIALAYASAIKSRPPGPPAFKPFWSGWSSSFGGYNKTDVNSTSFTSRLYGLATGLDYHYSPNTVLGFALAASSGNWSVAQALGGGHSNSLQVGVSDTTHFGPAYLAAALGFSNNWARTDRIAAGDEITAQFSQQSYSARLETGYRYVAAIAVTPYAALQMQDFSTPSFSETDLGGGNNAVAYSARNSIDTRSEFGARFDNIRVVNGMPLLLSARTGWAHDWITNPLVEGAFELLPTANLAVSPATPPHDSALVSASAELHITSAIWVIGQFYSELAASAQTYAGSASLRYSW